MNFMPAVALRPGAVRLGDLELACEIDGVAPGTDLTLAIRPEERNLETRFGQAYLDYKELTRRWF